MDYFLPLMTGHLRHQMRGRKGVEGEGFGAGGLGGGRGRKRKRREQSRGSVKAKWKQTCQAQEEVTGEKALGK